MFNFVKNLFHKKNNLSSSSEVPTEWERAIFYSELKGKDHKELHRIAFEQITETAFFTDNSKEVVLTLFWEEWEQPTNLRTFFKMVNEAIPDFKWKWFDEWNSRFLETGSYPHTWAKYKRNKNNTEKELKIALLYHSVHARFFELRHYENHYATLEECDWINEKYQIKLFIIDDDPVEEEIVKSITAIQDNQILSLPPYIPAGRAHIKYERIRRSK